MKILIITLAILGILAVAGCTQPTPGDGVNESETQMSLVTYGAFSPQDMVKTVVEVEPGKLTYRTYGHDGAVTRHAVKNLSEERYNSLLQAFKDADFMNLPRSIEPDANVADVGMANLTFQEDGKVKEVHIDPNYGPELPEGVNAILEEFNGLTMYAQSMTSEEAEQMAREWIEQAPTYAYDGQNLQLEEHHVLESYPEQHVLTYSFETRHGGYGNRSGQMVTQVITPHNITVRIAQRKVVDAVIDNDWDEINQRTVKAESFRMAYQPRQCQETPWQEWYGEGNAQFLQEPTDRELIIAYYGDKGVELEDVERVESDKVVCQACDICPTSYSFQATVSQELADMLREEGWREVGASASQETSATAEN